MEEIFKLYEGLARQGPGSYMATRRALCSVEAQLPDQPRILDIGCGAGAQTLALAELINGSITAIDIYQPFIEQLLKSISGRKLKATINCLNQDMRSLSFPEQSFNLIWSEGSIYLIGFETGLNDWKRLLKSSGFIVVSEISLFSENPNRAVTQYWQKYYPEIKSIDENLEIIEKLEFEIIDYFNLTADSWWSNYYEPLLQRIDQFNRFGDIHHRMQKVIAETLEEIDMFKKYSDQYGYEFYIMQKKE